MRRLWIRLVFWYNGVCPKHGRKVTGLCSACGEEKTLKHNNYLDAMLKEWNQ